MRGPEPTGPSWQIRDGRVAADALSRCRPADTIGLPPRQGLIAMPTSFTVDDMTIHRLIEQEAGFTPILEFLPSLNREKLDENREWLEPTALDPATHAAVLCFQSYIVKTPHHNILVDSCIGNDKSFPHRPTWHRKTDGNWMAA